VKFTEAHRHFLAALRRNPATPAPAVRTGTVADFRAWKAQMRGYDQARLDLGLVTADRLRIRNAAVPIHGRNARVVRHAQYA
jgi:hypothetical protein